MAMEIEKIFKKDKDIVIGSLHFPPLLGFTDFPGYKAALDMALVDLDAYEAGGVDGLFLENNYGLSKECIETPQAIAMGYLIGEIRKRTSLPLGVSVLWNDYVSAFALATTYDLDFIRVPVFVDEVEPYCGLILGDPQAVLKTRADLEADSVAIFADVLVKHSKHISTHSLEEATRKAYEAGADAVIVTGDWTGQAPTVETLTQLRSSVPEIPLLVGSGADKDNSRALSEYVNGFIVSTSLKEGAVDGSERNVKPYTERVSTEKVQQFVYALLK